MIRPLSARNEELDKVETTRSRAWRSFGAVSVDGTSSTCGVFRATVTVVNGVFIAAWLSGRGGGLILDNVYVRLCFLHRGNIIGAAQNESRVSL